MSNQNDRNEPGGYEEIANQIPSGFIVSDESYANWLVRKVKESRSYAEHVLQWAARELRAQTPTNTF